MPGAALRHYLQLASGTTVSEATVSRELTYRLGMTRKLMHNISDKRDEHDRTMFWCSSPLDAARPGVHGVPVHLLVTLDEKTIKFKELLVQRGHSLKGTPCIRQGPAPSSQPSFNCIFAMDVRVGCVAYLIYRGTLDRATFYAWVYLQVRARHTVLGAQKLGWA